METGERVTETGCVLLMVASAAFMDETSNTRLGQTG